MTEKLHSELGASSAERWMNCPGSVRASRGMPDNSSVYSREGTAAHALGERCLRAEVEPYAFLGASFEGVEVTEEMVEAVSVYVREVRRAQFEHLSILWIERPFDLASLNPPGPMWGTPDALVWQAKRKHLYVFDLKYGQGVAVDAKDNAQLRYYALGATLSLPPGAVPETITIVIVQPRASHPDGIVRSETLTFAELMDFTSDLMGAAQRTLAEDAPLVPGPWCRFCRAAPTCRALADHALAVAQVEFTAPEPVIEPPDPATLPKEVLFRALDHADVLEDWLRSVRAYALHKLEEDESWGEGRFKLVAKRATRRWASDAAVEEFAQRTGLSEDDIYAPRRLKSPAQLEKVVGKKGLPAELVVKESSGVTLVPVSDARPAANVSKGAEFAALPPASSTQDHETAETERSTTTSS